jgi:hypothetical protein
MVDDISKIMDRLKFVDGFSPFMKNENELSRLRVDLYDLIESSEWLTEEINKKQGIEINSKIAEEFLTELEYYYIDHMYYHLRSLRKNIRDTLKRFPDH